MTIYDRKNEYNNNNMSLCPKNCEYTNYNNITKKVSCECENQKSSSKLMFDDIVKKDKILNNFINIKSISNIEIIKCYKEIFSNKGLKSNIGSYILLIIIIIFILCCIFFYIKEYKILFDKIKNISKQNHFDKKEFVNKKVYNTKNNNNKKSKKKLHINKNNNNKNCNNNKIIQIKNKIIKSKSKNNKKNNNLITIGKSSTRIELNNSNNLNKNKENNIKVLNSKNNKKLDKYIESELNHLSYNDALKIDKRSFCQYYFSLIKTKHIIFFSFYPVKDYNSMIIKISLFFYSFSLFYTINALFFNDTTMHKIYEDEGIFNFIYSIPQMIYSSIISAAINSVIRYFSLTGKTILNLKKENVKKDLT